VKSDSKAVDVFIDCTWSTDLDPLEFLDSSEKLVKVFVVEINSLVIVKVYLVKFTGGFEVGSISSEFKVVHKL